MEGTRSNRMAPYLIQPVDDCIVSWDCGGMGLLVVGCWVGEEGLRWRGDGLGRPRTWTCEQGSEVPFPSDGAWSNQRRRAGACQNATCQLGTD